MPIGIATRKSVHVGAVPRWTLSIRVWGEKTRNRPAMTSSSWVRKSVTASATLTPADSLTPTTLIALRTPITKMPKKMSPGECCRAGQNRPPR